ncbi:MAG TPA: hypothetical protein VI341_13455 [Actinomycetota bacterium]
MIDEREIIQDAVARLSPPEPSFERLLRRRERKIRNKRIAAVVVAIAVLIGPIWLATTGGRSERTITPASTGPTAAPSAAGMGLPGLPPKGAKPSTPERGKLVLDLGFGHTSGDGGRFSLSMYEDGRVIWDRLGTTRGLIEQRLTAEGVDLVLAEVLSTGLFDHDRWFVEADGLYYGGVSVRSGTQIVQLAWGNAGFEVGIDAPETTPTPEQVRTLEGLDARLEDLTSWLPASAWDDPKYRAYVPSRYGVCYMFIGQDTPPGRLDVLDLLPSPAGDLLSTLDTTQSYPNGFRASQPFWCSVVSTEQARELVAIMRDAGPSSRGDGGLSYSYPLVDIGLEPALPEARASGP